MFFYIGWRNGPIFVFILKRTSFAETFRELELARQNERNLNERLATGEAERLDIEEKYNSLQDEVAGRTRRLKKVWVQYVQAKADLADTNAEHQREMEAMLESIRQLQKELALAAAITTAYIPDAYLDLVDRQVCWNEEIGDWQLRGIAYAGNNMRHNNNKGSVTISTERLSEHRRKVCSFWNFRLYFG